MIDDVSVRTSRPEEANNDGSSRDLEGGRTSDQGYVATKQVWPGVHAVDPGQGNGFDDSDAITVSLRIPRELVSEDPQVPREDIDGVQTQTWHGGFQPFVVGDPGHAAAGVVNRRDPDVPDRNDTIVDSAMLPDDEGRPSLELRAASVRGLTHRDGAKVRQDEYGFRRTTDGRHLIVAVADGVSEGELSHVAATVAVRQGCKLIEGWLRDCPPSQLPWEEILGVLRTDIEGNGRRLLSKRGVETDGWSTRDVARRLSTTLVLAVIDLVPDEGGHPVTLMRVGDSSAWIRGPAGRWENQYEVKNEGQAIASSATTALPYLTAIENQVTTRVRQGEVLVLMTDGIGDPLGDGRNDFGGFLAEMWSKPPPALAFAAHVDFARRSFDDDRTAVAMWPA